MYVISYIIVLIIFIAFIAWIIKMENDRPKKLREKRTRNAFYWNV